MNAMTRVCVVLLASTAAISSQPVRPEVFGYVGRVRAAADEGPLGSGVLWGGDVIVPIGHRLGIGIDAGTAKTGRSFSGGDFQLRRTFVGFSLLGRWGLERTYAFAGAGGGFEHSNSASTIGNLAPGFRPPNAEEVSPGVFRFRSSETSPSLVGRAGVVHAIRGNLLLRFDLLWSQRYVLPNIGGRVGLGYRF